MTVAIGNTSKRLSAENYFSYPVNKYYRVNVVIDTIS